MLMDKTDIPVVAIDEMNKIHESEIELVNDLYEIINSQLAGEPVKDGLDEAIAAFRSHMEHHFSREEEMMMEAGFPAYRVHKGEHDRVRVEMDARIEKWRNSNDIEPLSHYLRDTHPGWANIHISTMDTVTASYIARFRSS